MCHLVYSETFLFVKCQIVKRPLLKKCVIKGDNWSVKRPTKKLYILDAEVVLMTVWGAVCPNLWAIYRLP